MYSFFPGLHLTQVSKSAHDRPAVAVLKKAAHVALMHSDVGTLASLLYL